MIPVLAPVVPSLSSPARVIVVMGSLLFLMYFWFGGLKAKKNSSLL